MTSFGDIHQGNEIKQFFPQTDIKLRVASVNLHSDAPTIEWLSPTLFSTMSSSFVIKTYVTATMPLAHHYYSF